MRRGVKAAEQIGARYEAALLNYEIARHLPDSDPTKATHCAAALSLFEALGAARMVAKLQTVELILL